MTAASVSIRICNEYVHQRMRSFLCFHGSLEAINLQWLDQDDPCVVQIIRKKYLFKPFIKKWPSSTEVGHSSQRQAEEVFEILKYQVSYNNEA